MSGYYQYDQNKYKNATDAKLHGAATWIDTTPPPPSPPVAPAPLPYQGPIIPQLMPVVAPQPDAPASAPVSQPSTPTQPSGLTQEQLDIAK